MSALTLYKSTRLLLLAGLLSVCAACSEQGEPTLPATDLQIQVLNPLPAQALQQQNITGFDIYAEGPKLHAIFTAAAADPKHPFIGYLHSEDGGLHWSEPIDVGSRFNLAVESRQGNDIQLAVAGSTVLAVWQTTGELPGMGPLVAIYSLDGGISWQQGSNPGSSDTDQSHPDLIADVQGRFHLVWLDDRDENGYQGLRYARSSDAGGHWELAQTIDASSCSCCWNRLAVSATGQINVLYRDMQPRDMALAQSNDAGASWQRISNVGEFNWQFDGCPHNGGGLSQGPDGMLHSVVWTGADNQVGLYYLQSADNGKSWSRPMPLAAGTPAFHSDIAANGRNRLAVVWDALEPTGSTVLLADSKNQGGDWSPARQLSTPGTVASHPRIVATASGWLALWTEQSPQAAKQWRIAVIQ